ncbi:hypothetical protein GCT13_47325 [Paraburkholderia sp. CNPSo 3157]|uniref:Uncharacterized protein n=1 Tax=Paraburkholderia franconis TaxID=2654983 RepID=A0A7X1NL85_9BURK|nr:hypothetical protein [Paraburkholderia franconis]MPW24063.1 hypothetical protein [Paraburkholderia franconis]
MSFATKGAGFVGKATSRTLQAAMQEHLPETRPAPGFDDLRIYGTKAASTGPRGHNPADA